MTDNPRKVVGLLATVLFVWVMCYWMWPASRTPLAFGEPPEGFTPPKPLTQLEPEPVTPREAAPKATSTEPAPIKMVEKPRFREYTIRKGDVSFEAIAARPDVFGNKKYARAIQAANPLLSPDKLIAGRTVIKIPLDPENIQGKVVEVTPPAPVPKSEPKVEAKPQPKTEPKPEPVKPTPAPPAAPDKPTTEFYIVKDGDTLSKIAKQKYGRSGLWELILEANADQLDDASKLKPGMKLKIPPKPKD